MAPEGRGIEGDPPGELEAVVEVDLDTPLREVIRSGASSLLRSVQTSTRESTAGSSSGAKVTLVNPAWAAGETIKARQNPARWCVRLVMAYPLLWSDWAFL